MPSTDDAIAEPQSEPTAKRGGRNLRAATAVGLGLLAVVALTLLVRKEFFLVTVTVLLCVGLWELDQAFARRSLKLPLVPLWIGTAGICVSTYQAGLEGLLVAMMLTIVAAVVWRLVDGGGAAAVRDCAAAIFAIAWLPFLAGFLILILASENGQWKVLLFVLLAVSSDVGGFYAGTWLGKHPLAPTVSPKKTWEGLAGSFALALVVGSVGARLLDLDPVSGIMLGLLTPISATLGDLAESLIKRDLGLKDMGSLLPGHGGVLDRIDSMLLTAPFVYVVFSVSSRISG